ncbi:hypothetical protein E4U56_002037 [Claviceps arundinis]|uniref:Uncharacterized protein n=1 Tax=Claviceps arundinis TaxID=1623583 RepID=A0A9P7SMG8_9HYPO|nr:hypothetical protein E4U56_002037 [Claviceps arundinis]
MESIKIYDGANMDSQEYTSIFHVAPNFRRIKARSATMSCIATLLLRNSNFTAPNVINKIDPNLKTLFYKIVPEADDPVLAAIPTQILQVPAKASRDRISYQRSQKKRNPDRPRIWKPVQPFPYTVDLQKCRHGDAAHPRNNFGHFGLCSEGFKAIMGHGTFRITAVACRHISQQAFEHVFNAKAVHPELNTLEVNRDIYLIM